RGANRPDGRCESARRWYQIATTPLISEGTMAKAAPKTPGSAKSAGKPAALMTVTLRQVAAELAEKHDLTKKDAEAILNDLVLVTTRHLKKGARLRLTGLGILQVRHRAARMGRNPATGEPIKIKASKKIAFRPAKELKDSI
ncbi:MAG: HU family DNA-binding protein, partial [Steroidobacteraceae bacterium]